MREKPKVENQKRTERITKFDNSLTKKIKLLRDSKIIRINENLKLIIIFNKRNKKIASGKLNSINKYLYVRA